MSGNIINSFDVWISARGLKSKLRLRNIDNISLDGIDRLRQLILELAIRGKLVPQDSKEEPASVLLQRVKDKRARLGSKEKLTKVDATKINERPFDLPTNWEFVRLKEIAEINPRNEVDDDTVEASFVPMNMVSTSYAGMHKSETRRWSDIKKGFTHFANGDLGVAKITPCFENSKAIILSGLQNGIGAGTTELFIARPYDEELNRRFILLNLKSPSYLKLGESKMTGTAGQKRLPRSFFEGNPLPMPPLAEQHRIVAKVDELMTLCDELENQETHHLKSHQLLVETLLGTLTQANDAAEFQTAWSRLAQHFDEIFTTEDSIDQLKQTILQLAVMGKLVPQDPNDEPASELLKRIEREKERLVKDGKIKKEKPLREISNDEVQIELPNAWAWCRLGSFTTIKGGKRLPNGEVLTKEPTDHIYIRVTDMKDNTIDDTDLHYITDAAYEKIKQYIIEKNDIYLTIVGATIGKLGLVPEKFHKMNLTENAARIIIYEVDRVFLAMALNSDFMQNQFFDKTNQVGVPKLALHRVSNSIFPLPPLEEQFRIRDKIKEVYAMCDRLKERIGESQKITNDLARSVLNLV